MKKKIRRQDVINHLTKIALGKTNDAVKLAFYDGEENRDFLEELDLTLLSEVKKTPNGAVEIKLINRLEVIKLLLNELQEKKTELGEAESFFMAMDKASKQEKASDGI